MDITSEILAVLTARWRKEPPPRCDDEASDEMTVHRGVAVHACSGTYCTVSWNGARCWCVRGVSYRAAANPKYLGVPQLTVGRGWRASMGLDEPWRVP